MRGMDCAVSALVTQIVRTLQRNKCIFRRRCTGRWEGGGGGGGGGRGFLRDTAGGGGGMMRLIDAPVPRRPMLREQVKRVSDERCHRHTQEQPGADYCTLIHHRRTYNT